MADAPLPAPSGLPQGYVIGYYTVVARLGRGSFGTTYRVTRDGKDYALKLASYSLAELDPEERQRHEQRADREVSALKNLRHPNIVRCHAFDRWPDLENGHPYLVMDLVEGVPLYEWQRRTTPSARRIAHLFAKLADALDAMHAVDIFHRDLKNENIFVRLSDGEPMILDFGISRPRLSYPVTREHVLVGTYSHLSPEYAAFYFTEQYQRGERYPFTPRDDLHAVGYMLYRMLAGRSPFGDPNGDDHHLLFRQIIDTIPVPPAGVNPRVPAPLAAIVMRLLAKDPATRHQSGAELAADLRAWLDAATPSADSPLDLPAPHVTEAPAISLASADVQPVSAHAGPPPVPSNAGVPSSTKAPRAVRLTASARPRTAPVFSPPTNAASPSGEAAPAAVPDPLDLPPELRAASEQLRATRKLPLPLLFGGGLVLVVGLFVGFLALTTSPKGDNLLAKVQREQTQSGRHPAPTASAGPLAATVPSPRVDAPAPAVTPAPVAVAPSPTSRSAERDIDRILRNTYGGRPTLSASDGSLVVRPDHPTPTPTPVDAPSWLQRGLRVDRAPQTQPTGPRSYGVPTGAHIRARLAGNLDSRTIGSGPAEVILLKPFIIDATQVFPARTMLYGTASVNGDRFNIRFTRARLPDRTEVRLAGLAYDIQDLKPGLPASRKIAAAASGQGESLGAQVAKGAANVGLSQLTGGVAQDLARTAGSTVVNASGSVPSTPRDALLLDAGLDFDVFIEEPF